MSKILEEVKNYLSSATLDILEKDWKEFKSFSKIGPSVKNFKKGLY